ncbi:HET-domain-containing protein [Colletotrichum asianum]
MAGQLRSFKACFNYHAQCRSQGIGDSSDDAPEILELSEAPSRLLHIRLRYDKLFVTLTDTSAISDTEIGQRLSAGGYVTLPYCWGGDQPVKLMATSQDSLKQGIASTDLPQTLCDAVTFCHSMGLEFIWIDALCILQDSDEDKGNEIARMRDYYQKSVLTICAASASHCAQGLFDINLPSYGMGPIKLTFQPVDGKPGYIFLSTTPDPQPEVMTTRGWTLQESMLSRRMVIFAQDQLYWSCQTSYSACSGVMINRSFGGPQSLVENIYPITTLYERPLQSQWEAIVRNYSRRHLGFAADKLPAASGLASVVHDIARSRGFDKYVLVAGLFIDMNQPHSWADELQWCTRSIDASRYNDYVAPSWSWASVNGAVYVYPRGVHKAPRESSSQFFTVEDYGVTLVNRRIPYGAVTNGFLALKASLRSFPGMVSLDGIDIISASEDATRDDRPRESQLQAITNPYLEIIADTRESQLLIEASCADTGVFLLRMGPASGLLVTGLDLAEGHRRLGYFEVQENEKGGESLGKSTEAMTDLVFEQEKFQSILLV